MNSNNNSEQQTAGVKVRPPFLFGGTVLLGLALDWLLPLTFASAWSIGARGTLGGGLIIAGVLLFVASTRNFTRAGTPIPTSQPTTALVTDGVHGWSRNPIYVSLFTTYLGIALAAASAWMLILVVPVALLMRYAVVAREEAYLEQRFGDSYRDYKRRVRRWL